MPPEVSLYNSNVVYTRKHMHIILMSLLPTIHLENSVAHSGSTLKLTIPTHCPRLLPVEKSSSCFVFPTVASDPPVESK